MSPSTITGATSWADNWVTVINPKFISSKPTPPPLGVKFQPRLTLRFQAPSFKYGS